MIIESGSTIKKGKDYNHLPAKNWSSFAIRSTGGLSGFKNANKKQPKFPDSFYQGFYFQGKTREDIEKEMTMNKHIFHNKRTKYDRNRLTEFFNIKNTPGPAMYEQSKPDAMLIKKPESLYGSQIFSKKTNGVPLSFTARETMQNDHMSPSKITDRFDKVKAATTQRLMKNTQGDKDSFINTKELTKSTKDRFTMNSKSHNNLSQRAYKYGLGNTGEIKIEKPLIDDDQFVKSNTSNIKSYTDKFRGYDSQPVSKKKDEVEIHHYDEFDDNENANRSSRHVHANNSDHGMTTANFLREEKRLRFLEENETIYGVDIHEFFLNKKNDMRVHPGVSERILKEKNHSEIVDQKYKINKIMAGTNYKDPAIKMEKMFPDPFKGLGYIDRINESDFYEPNSKKTKFLMGQLFRKHRVNKIINYVNDSSY